MQKRGEQIKRIWELDFLRSLALILMVVFHIVYDLNEFADIPVSYDQGFYYYVGKISAVLFMLLAGVSSVLSRNNVRRGLKLLFYAGLISIVTHLWDPNWGVKWGILHFLGTSILLFPIFKRFPVAILLILGGILIYMGSFLPTVKYGFLFPLGLKSSGFSSSDYYPLVPWLSVYLFGIGLGKILYRRPVSLFRFEVSEKNPLMFLGANTLLIYLVHQPLIILLIELVRLL